MRKVLVSAAVCLALAGAVAPASAELELEKVVWQSARWEGGKAQKAADIDALSFDPAKRFQGRILAKLTVLNRGASMKGVLLRFAMTGRVAPRGGALEAVWSIPFMIDQKRVPNVGANQRSEVTLDPTELLALYLRRVDRSGWWPLELKLDVMVEPHPGDKGPLKQLSVLLPVKP